MNDRMKADTAATDRLAAAYEVANQIEYVRYLHATRGDVTPEIAALEVSISETLNPPPPPVDDRPYVEAVPPPGSDADMIMNAYVAHVLHSGGKVDVGEDIARRHARTRLVMFYEPSRMRFRFELAQPINTRVLEPGGEG